MKWTKIAGGIRIAVAVLLALTALSAAGCEGQKDTGPALFDDDEISAEYDAAAADLELPPGFTFPGMPFDGEEGMWEEGSGLVNAQMYWQRAWELEWLEQRGKDPAREAAALDVLMNQVPEMEFMTRYADDASRSIWAEYAEQAAMGDPSGIQQDVDANPIRVTREDEE